MNLSCRIFERMLPTQFFPIFFIIFVPLYFATQHCKVFQKILFKAKKILRRIQLLSLQGKNLYEITLS